MDDPVEMLYEDGDVMVYEDYDVMVYEYAAVNRWVEQPNVQGQWVETS